MRYHSQYKLSIAVPMVMSLYIVYSTYSDYFTRSFNKPVEDNGKSPLYCAKITMARNKRSKDKAATGSLMSVSAGKSQRVRFQPLFDRHQATVHKNRVKVRIGTWNVRTLHI